MDRKTYEDQQEERQIVALERIAKILEEMDIKLDVLAKRIWIQLHQEASDARPR